MRWTISGVDRRNGLARTLDVDAPDREGAIQAAADIGLVWDRIEKSADQPDVVNYHSALSTEPTDAPPAATRSTSGRALHVFFAVCSVVATISIVACAWVLLEVRSERKTAEESRRAATAYAVAKKVIEDQLAAEGAALDVHIEMRDNSQTMLLRIRNVGTVPLTVEDVTADHVKLPAVGGGPTAMGPRVIPAGRADFWIIYAKDSSVGLGRRARTYVIHTTSGWTTYSNL